MSTEKELFRTTVECEEHYYRNTPQGIPEIKLFGGWLTLLGFKPGDNIHIAASKGEIILRLAGERLDDKPLHF